MNQPLTAAANYLAACARRLRGLGDGHEDVLAMIDHASQETLKAGEIIRRTRNFVVNGRISGSRENLRTMVERAILMLGEPAATIVGITTAGAARPVREGGPDPDRAGARQSAAQRLRGA